VPIRNHRLTAASPDSRNSEFRSAEDISTIVAIPLMKHNYLQQQLTANSIDNAADERTILSHNGLGLLRARENCYICSSTNNDVLPKIPLTYITEARRSVFVFHCM
jgi:hypothetical protein